MACDVFCKYDFVPDLFKSKLLTSHMLVLLLVWNDGAIEVKIWIDKWLLENLV